jgi:hypothetical protein
MEWFMRYLSSPSVHRLAALLAVAVSTTLSSASGGSDELPMRKAGLWQLTTTMDEGMGPREHAFKMCIGADMEQNTVRASLTDHKQNCKTYQVNQTGGATTVDAECTFNGADVSSRTEMSGDFKQDFEIKIESTTIQSGGNQSRSVKRTIKQTGHYLAEACGDLAPGEAMGPDGNKIAVQ